MLTRVLALTVSLVLLLACAAPQDTGRPPLASLGQTPSLPPTPADSPSVSIAASPTETPGPSGPYDALPTLPPFAGLPTLDGHRSGLQAGCRGTIYYLTTPIHGDACGLLRWDEVLRLDPLRASLRARVLLEAPEAYVFSVADAHLASGWSVRIALARALRRGTDIPLDGIASRIGTVVASGLGPNKRISVRMPAREGRYVVELTGPVARDGWTFPGSLYYWLVEVG
jgi:hypothetical protein